MLMAVASSSGSTGSFMVIDQDRSILDLHCSMLLAIEAGISEVHPMEHNDGL